jgi:long-subunit fatty acid transport protein
MTRKSRALLAGAAWFGLLGLWATIRPVFGSNGTELIGVSTQARSRGGADIAVGDSPLSQIDNPASLLLHGRDVDFAGKLVLPRSRWTNTVDTGNTQIGVIPILNLAGSRPVNERMSWGWALHTKSGLASAYTIEHFATPGLRTTERVDFENADLQLNGAIQLTDRLSLGAGVRGEFVTTKFNITAGPAFASVERGYAVGTGLHVGLLYQLAEDWRLGFAYRSPTWMTDIDGGHLELSFFGDPTTTLDLGPASLSGQLPQKLTLGAAWDATDWLMLTTEVRWINFADSIFNNTSIESNGLPGLVPTSVPFPLGYRDQFVLATGADVRLTDRWILGLGYNYGSDLVPATNLLPIGSILSQHHLTTGIRYDCCKWWAGVGYILALTTGLAGDGTSAFPGPNDYSGSYLSQTQHNIFFGFGIRR